MLLKLTRFLCSSEDRKCILCLLKSMMRAHTLLAISQDSYSNHSFCFSEKWNNFLPHSYPFFMSCLWEAHKKISLYMRTLQLHFPAVWENWGEHRGVRTVYKKVGIMTNFSPNAVGAMVQYAWEFSNSQFIFWSSIVSFSIFLICCTCSLMV